MFLHEFGSLMYNGVTIFQLSNYYLFLTKKLFFNFS